MASVAGIRKPYHRILFMGRQFGANILRYRPVFGPIRSLSEDQEALCRDSPPIPLLTRLAIGLMVGAVRLKPIREERL
jgi:hypothetical protein